LHYEAEKGWELEDGFNGKESTNGTWLFLSEFCRVHDKDILKVGQSAFEIKIKEV